MRSLIQLLIAEEQRTAGDSAAGGGAGFRVCAKLRRPLSVFAGVGGFRSLLSRALALAKTEAPLLAGVTIRPDATLEFLPELEARLGSEEVEQAAALLAGRLVGLLVIFIGEALTLRLLNDVWPNAADQEQQSEGK